MSAGHYYRIALLSLGALISGGCDGTSNTSQPPDSAAAVFGLPAIETDAQGRCFGRDITPAVIETVTAQELDRPAVLDAAGTVTAPAAYRTVTRQQIVRDRSEVQFETLCPPAFTHDLVATLQRALTARGFYRGPINGILDAATGRAVQDFQRSNGPDSPLLSIEAARRLGLVALAPEQLAG